MKDDLLRQANEIVNARDIREALKNLRELYLEDVALTAKSIYDEHIKAGFTEGQALDIAKAYTLEFCTLEWIPLDEDDDD